MVLNKKSAISKIRSDWGSQPQSEICISVLDYITRSSVPLTHITFGSIRRVVGKNFLDEEILDSLQYLCGDRVHLLEVGFEFSDNPNSSPVDITPSEINEANSTGQLLHPETGKLIDDFEDKVYIYFQTSESSSSIR